METFSGGVRVGPGWELHFELEAAVHRADFNLREAAVVAKGCSTFLRDCGRVLFCNSVIELERAGAIVVQRGVGANGDCQLFGEDGQRFAPSEPACDRSPSGLEPVPCMPWPRTSMPRTEPDKKGVVYILGSPSSRLVKIGHSSRLPARVGDIQRMSPVPLSALWTYPGGKALEGALHRFFKDFRRHGEWFDFGGINPVAAVAADVAWLVTGQPDWPGAQFRYCHGEFATFVPMDV